MPRSEKKGDAASTSAPPRDPLYFFDLVEDYPEIGGVAAVSRRLREALTKRFGRRLVIVRDIATSLGCGDAAEGYLPRERRAIQRLAERTPASIFLVPNFQNPIARNPHRPRPQIVNVIHDVQFAHLPDLFTDEQRAWLNAAFAETRANADAVAFVSRATRDDFTSRFGAPATSVVIPAPVGPCGYDASSPLSPTPYLLAVQHGDYHPHKNVDGLLRLFAGLAERIPELSLIVTGRGDVAFRGACTRLPAALRNRIEHHGFVPRDELTKLYIGATAFVSMSRFEGFNMPAAEAASCGAPLILSDVPVHRELHAAAACFLDPCSPDLDRAARYLTDEAGQLRGYVWAHAAVCHTEAVGLAHAQLLSDMSAEPPLGSSWRASSTTRVVGGTARRSGPSLRQVPMSPGRIAAPRQRLARALLTGTILGGAAALGTLNGVESAKAATRTSSCNTAVNASGGTGGASSEGTGNGGSGGSTITLTGGNGAPSQTGDYGSGYYYGGGGGGAGGDCVSPAGGAGGNSDYSQGGSANASGGIAPGASNGDYYSGGAGGGGGYYGGTLTGTGKGFAGGAGQSGGAGGGGAYITGGGGGGGGGLGTAIVSGTGELNGASLGGAGGAGGGAVFGTGGTGGGGGNGTAVFNGSALTIDQGASSRGGDGGAGGSASGGTVGTGGSGGIGLLFTDGGSVTNAGTIAGGSGGASGTSEQGDAAAAVATPPPPNGLGGAGVVGAGIKIITSGLISGGLSGDRTAQADSIRFTGGANQLTLQNGFNFVGNIDIAAAGSSLTFVQKDNVVLATLVTGLGSVTKSDSGTLILTAANTYAGGTTISGGTLQIGNGGTTGSIMGNVADNAVVAFARSDALTYGGVISGTGSLNQAGPGTLILTAANTYAGGTTISGGTLQIGNGGTTGSITGNVADSAVVAFARSDTLTYGGVISGTGSLNQAGLGTLILTAANTYAGGTTISGGTLQIGNGGTAGSIVGNITDNAVVAFERSDNLTYGGVISGTGSLNQAGPGTLNLTGASTYTGSTLVQAGRLVVNGSLGNTAVTVAPSATLGGSGTIAGNVTIADGGILAPGNSPGTITVGNLTLTPGTNGSTGSVLNYELGTIAASNGLTSDLTNVIGNLTLAGTLNAADAGGFTYGSYRIFNYGGTLTNDGLAIGSLPTGYTGVIQTAIPNQINLVLASPTTPVQFWDGPLTTGNGPIAGGTGTWSNTQTNWTDPNGANNAAWGGGVANFAGAAGTVTVADTIAFQGLQFATDGYTIAAAPGGSLVPTGQAFVRVSPGETATIAAPLTGVGSLQKLGAGTLILSGMNTYTGGTTIGEGTLQIGNGGTTGSIVGNIVDNASLVFARTDAVTYGGVISGSGALTQAGIGTLSLTGASTYTGFTVISPGATLALAGRGSIAESSNLVNGGTFNVSQSAGVSIASLGGTGTVVLGAQTLTLTAASGTFGGKISGGGGLILQSGTEALTGANTYSGGTLLRAGTLVIGNAKAIGSGQLAMDAGTTLAFAGDLTLGNGVRFTGAADPTIDTGANTDTITSPIDGPGALTKNGSGTLILTGTDSYSGITTIAAGTLEVDGSVAASATTVNSGATLSGTGTVGSITARSGATVAPGTAASPYGVLYTPGSAAFLAGSTYKVNISPTGQTSALVIAGAASLGGAAVTVASAAGAYSLAARYNILTATGGVQGQFRTLSSATALAFLNPYLSYSANTVTLAFQSNGASFTDVAFTPNERSVAAAIQSLDPNSVVVRSLQGLPQAQARLALDGLAGAAHASAATTAAQDSRRVSTQILDRLWNIGGGEIDARTLLQQIGAPGELPAFVNCYAPLPPPTPRTPPSIVTAWGEGFGDFGHDGSDRNGAGLDRKLGGFIIGYDAPLHGLGAPYRVGIAGGYTKTSFSGSGSGGSGSNGTFESVFASIYGGARYGAIDVRGGVTAAGSSTTVDRTVAYPGFADGEHSVYGGNTEQLFAEVGYRFSGTRWVVEPIVSAAYTHVHQNDFYERGGAAALFGFAQENDVGTSTVGLRGEYAPFVGLPLVARAFIGWRYGFGDINPATKLAFEAGSISFTSQGAAIDRNALASEIGLDWRYSGSMTLGLAYTGQIGERDSDNGVKGRMEYKF